MIGTLSKLEALTDVKSANPLRTKSMRGSFEHMPFPGKPFVIVNDEPLDKSGGATNRVIITSPVQRILDSDVERIVFATENSKYELVLVLDEK